MPDKMQSAVPNQRGHVLCCAAVVFVCFVLTCLNLYMLSSTRDVVRRLDVDVRNQQKFLLQSDAPQQAALQDEGWKDMQKQLLEQHLSQQKHIEDLQQQLADSFRARDEQQKGRDQAMRETQMLQRQKQLAVDEHQRELARRDKLLLSHKTRAMKQEAKHQSKVKKYQEQLQKLRLQKQPEPLSEEDDDVPDEPMKVEVQVADAPPTTAQPTKENSTEESTPSVVLPPPGADGQIVTHIELIPPQHDGMVNPLDHILGAVFGPGPGTFFFPRFPDALRRQPPMDKGNDGEPEVPEEHHVVHRVLDEEDEPVYRVRRDLLGRTRTLRGQPALVLARLRARRRRHDETGPPMMIGADGPEPLPVASDAEEDTRASRVLKRHA